MNTRELIQEIQFLYLEWQCHDGTDSRYSALLHLLKIWMYDANNQNEDNSRTETEKHIFGDDSVFPSEIVLRLVNMTSSEDRNCRAMAFCALVLVVMRFDSILPKQVKDAIAGLYSNETLRKEMVEVQQYFFTSIISMKVKEKISDRIPKIMHQQENMRRKLGIEDVKRQVSEMVEDGVDFNQQTFIVMSQNEFFKKLKNWLIEFDVQNPAVNLTKKQGALALFSGMTNLCDLDKYALALTMNKADILNILTDGLPEGMIESINKDKMQDSMRKVSAKYAYMYAFQTIYRLFRLSPWRKILEDPFQMGPFMSDFSTLFPFTDSNDFFSRMADLFSRHEFYAHAAFYARILLQQKGEDTEEMKEMLQILALCDKYLGENKERLKCLLKLEKMDPDDLDLAAETGLCLINEKKYDKALERFFHLEIMEKSTRRSSRAIAWCSLMTGNYKRSERYYRKLLSWKGGPSWEDLLNSGHSAWLSGDPVRASQLYASYLEKHQDNMEAFDTDVPELIRLGLNEDDINLMKATFNV